MAQAPLRGSVVLTLRIDPVIVSLNWLKSTFCGVFGIVKWYKVKITFRAGVC